MTLLDHKVIIELYIHLDCVTKLFKFLFNLFLKKILDFKNIFNFNFILLKISN